MSFARVGLLESPPPPIPSSPAPMSGTPPKAALPRRSQRAALPQRCAMSGRAGGRSSFFQLHVPVDKSVRAPLHQALIRPLPAPTPARTPSPPSPSPCGGNACSLCADLDAISVLHPTSVWTLSFRQRQDTATRIPGLPCAAPLAAPARSTLLPPTILGRLSFKGSGSRLQPFQGGRAKYPSTVGKAHRPSRSGHRSPGTWGCLWERPSFLLLFSDQVVVLNGPASPFESNGWLEREGSRTGRRGRNHG